MELTRDDRCPPHILQYETPFDVEKAVLEMALRCEEIAVNQDRQRSRLDLEVEMGPGAAAAWQRVAVDIVFVNNVWGQGELTEYPAPGGQPEQSKTPGIFSQKDVLT